MPAKNQLNPSVKQNTAYAMLGYGKQLHNIRGGGSKRIFYLLDPIAKAYSSKMF